jgi:predicted RecB family nuclease
MSADANHITPTQLAGHLCCPHLTQLERQRREGLLTIEFKPDPRLDALRARGRQHEQAYVDRLGREGRTTRDLRDERDPNVTLRAMKSGVDVIVQAPLGNDVFRGIADVLLRVDSASSSLPGYAYEPGDTKLSHETKAGTILQLCTYAELLQPLQGVAPERFHVITPLRQETYRTAQFAAYYRHVRARVQEAVTVTPPPSTYPHPVPHCDICIYWRHCEQRRRADDHPSFIAGIRSEQIREFEQQGIRTLRDIAICEGQLPTKPTRGAAESYVRIGQQARLQFASRGVAVPVLEALPPEPGRGLARLPEPSAGDIFLDFEGDPFVAPHGLEYLTGYCSLSARGEMALVQQWALGAAQEKAAFESFIDFAFAQLQIHPGTHVYHFGAYEPAALKRLAARHAARGEELDRLLRGRRFVDLHAVTREALRIGVERYGLKELEAMHGFSRQLDLRDAAAARRDVELALELGDAHGIADETRERVAVYNGDDCRSTAALRAWLEQQRAAAIVRGDTIVRRVAGEMAPTVAVGDRDQRIAALRVALRQGLPEEADARTPEQNARALLAAMLGYFRQEDKNAWWEYFRLRDLPPAEQLDEREVLAGLQLTGQLPQQGRQKNPRLRFSFPPQDTAFSVGDEVRWAVWHTSGAEPEVMHATVEQIDLAERTVVLSMNEAAATSKPTAVFRDPVVGAKVLEDALLALARSVLVDGFVREAPYAAALDLLLRCPPGNAGGAPLRHAGESAGDALVRLCRAMDGGVLPVQGPPGSGKSTVGARAIVALAAAGKRIGVTAVSHKVIDNLLSKVREAERESGSTHPLRLVHKPKTDEKEPAPPEIEYITDSKRALKCIGPNTVVGGTAWFWADTQAREQLDYLFVDEAGQMALAQVLAAARAARNLVLLGDPQQLEQPTRGAHEDGADVAALVHLLDAGKPTLGQAQGLFLDATYRLHPVVCAFTSEAYYEGRLHAAPGLERQTITGPTPYAGAGLHLVPVMHRGNQARSDEEVDAVAHIAASLLQPGVEWTDAKGATRALTPKDILVVAPYNAQVSALRQRLATLQVQRVGTVDKFQGQEAPVVIYSCTSSSPEDAPRGMAFLYDPHRFNVATSRARAVVIVVASPRLFEPECRTVEQMGWANGFCRFAEMAANV